MFKRYSKKPIISPKDIVSSHPEMIDVSSVFNPGGTQLFHLFLIPAAHNSINKNHHLIDNNPITGL